MKVIYGMHNLSRDFYGCVLTIGNFDGVHRGHQMLLQRLHEEGNKRKLPVVVVIFEPQPLELFKDAKAPARLTCFREKVLYIKQYGIDYLLCIRFNRRFAALSAHDFISNLLVGHLGVRFLVVGDDFRFGIKRQGDFLLLKKASLEYGFEITRAQTVYENGVRISSTSIRQALEKDNLQMAERLLGYPFSISGRVTYGDKLGRRIGFPTANIFLRRRVTPVKGVYAVEVEGLGSKFLPGIANIGTRPTISSRLQELLEVHLFDVDINIYRRRINVILRKKIRNEQKFSSLANLRTQITKDELIARDFLKELNPF